MRGTASDSTSRSARSGFRRCSGYRIMKFTTPVFRSASYPTWNVFPSSRENEVTFLPKSEANFDSSKLTSSGLVIARTSQSLLGRLSPRALDPYTKQHSRIFFDLYIFQLTVSAGEPSDGPRSSGCFASSARFRGANSSWPGQHVPLFATYYYTTTMNASKAQNSV